MNDLKIKTEDEKIKVFINDKEIKYITKLSLNLETGSMRTLKLECIVNNINIDAQVDKNRVAFSNSIE